MSVVIKVENISKQYRLGSVGTGSLAHDLNRTWHRVRGKEDPYLKIGETNDRATKGGSDYVWALKDINFEVQQGEVLGIIGRNGAGKSTLLKILSRTTSPTTGCIKIKGRVASLLEVGTGFHPELSGRENIFLNGAILGMTRAEIKSKFDEIVDFAGVERYIDTPVKRYSSGMYVRLAFGVAAHLEPEILIVDEVLAVGDAEFQKKALGKMKDVSSMGGRTVLFVSHNMAAVKSICNSGLLLKNGAITMIGASIAVVENYLSGDSAKSNHKVFQKEISNEGITINEIKIHSDRKSPADVIIEGERLALSIILTISDNKCKQYHLTFHMYNDMGEIMFSFSNARDGMPLKNGLNRLTCYFPEVFFNTGNFYISLLVVKNGQTVVIHEKDILSFTVVDKGASLGTWMGREPGSIKPSFEWTNQ